MKLYHISLYGEEDSLIKKFNPRIPDCACASENKTIPRVCFSETVGGCFDAVPITTRNELNAAGEKFVLYELETSDYPDDFFILNKEIVSRKLVPDANTTKECWLIKPISLKGTVCEITNIERDLIFDFSSVEASDVVLTAEQINKKLYDLFEPFEIDQLKTLNPEDAYNEIIDRADANKVWDIVDDLFYFLGSEFPEAARVKTKIEFDRLKELELPCCKQESFRKNKNKVDLNR